MITSQSSYIRKDMSNVSFVGLHNTREGIIAFADSKATISYSDGHQKEDIQRGKINKIFKNKKFICVSHGNNELFSSQNRKEMEKYIKENLRDNIDYDDFFHTMFTRLVIDKPDYNDGVYQFIIGSKDENGAFYIRKLQMVVNTYNDMKYSEKDYSYKAYYAGEQKYVKIYDYYPKYYDADIQDYAIKIKNSLSQLVNSFYMINQGYETVGLPINVDIFQ